MSSPDIRALDNVSVEAYPDGWPTDPAVLEHASTVVWYFDGLEVHPLLDATRRAQFDRLRRQGVGLVTFHQASTLPPADTLHVPPLEGGKAFGVGESARKASRARFTAW